MKTNEAPEKIWVKQNAFKNPWPLYIDENSNYDGVEYTRTDAFIEKAISWLNDWFTDDSCKCGIPITKTAREDFFDDFRKDMKGE